MALASSTLGVDAKIVMPIDAPPSKLEATRNYGATVVAYDRRAEDRDHIALKIAEEEGRVLVPPYDDAWIMAGQGTAALELLEDVADLDAVVTPVGGGGLLAGTATALKARRPASWLSAPSPRKPMTPRGRWKQVSACASVPPETIADGARVEIPGEKTFPILMECAEAVVRVPDEALVEAMRLILTRLKILVEPTGALRAAAALEGLLPDDVERVGVVLSGGT